MEPGRGRRADVVKGKGSASSRPTPAGGSPRPAGSSGKKSKKADSRRPFYALLGIVGVAGAVFILFQLTRPGTAVATIDPNTPLPTAEGYVLGNPSAPVQVLEFADFECPACGDFAVVTEPDVRKRLIETGQISLRFLDFPLPSHRNSFAASNAAACANEQGKFWEMHDAIFENQDRWNGIATSRPKGVFEDLARQVGLDVGKWEECFDAQKYRLNIAANQREGERRRVSSTPTFVIGTRMIPGNLGFDRIRAYVDTALAEAKTRGGADSVAAKAAAPAAKDTSAK
jgi:protein-disulfide isomerase